MRPRDTQRARLYAAEGTGGCTSAAAERWLYPHEEKVPSIGAVNAYVVDLMESRWLRARWGMRSIEVYHGGGNVNALGGGDRVSLPRWSRVEGTILHEIAHCLTPRRYAAHGPEFAGVLLTLYRHRIGAEAARALRVSFRQHRVRVSLAAVPAPRVSVPPTPAQVTARRAAAARTRPVSAEDAAAAAATIRRAAAQGRFGPAGRKPRVHALATARLLEQPGV